MADSPVHYLAIGHVAKDLMPEGPRLGGTVSFASLTARALEYAPGVVTACGADLDVSALDGIPLARAASSHSTTFENVYSAQGRQQFVRALAAPLTAAAIPPAWLGARVAHLAPLDGEIGEDVLPALGQTFVGVTPQGWLRQWDETGRVRAAVDEWAGAAAVLSRANAVVLSLDDIGRDWAVAERWAKLAAVLVITEGPGGCTVFVRGQGARQFLAPHEVEVDPTGAGDVFAAAFLATYVDSGNPLLSARFANAAASFSIEKGGIGEIGRAHV